MAVKAQSHSMVVLDCCYSGALVKQNNLGRLSKKWKQGAGRVFLTSSGDNDVTYHMAGARNSALTSAVLGQLRSGVTEAQSVARGVQAHFAEHPYWGRSMKAEERGSEFSLYHPRAPALRLGTAAGRVDGSRKASASGGALGADVTAANVESLATASP